MPGQKGPVTEERFYFTVNNHIIMYALVQTIGELAMKLMASLK